MVSSATASAFLPGVLTTGIPRSVAAATSTFTGPPRAQQTSRSRRGVEDLGADRRAVDDEHVMPGHGPGDVGRVADVFAEPVLRLGARRREPHPLDLHRGHLHHVAEPGQGLGVGGRGHVRIADHQDTHRVRAAHGKTYVGSRSIACPLPDSRTNLSIGDGVQVVELDGLPDPPAHQDLRAALLPVLLERLAVLGGVLHAGDVLDALAVGVQELLVDAGAADRLDQLEAEPVHRRLGADHAEFRLLAAHHGVVQQRRLVVEHAPRAPAEVLGVGPQGGVHVGHDHRDLGDGHRDRGRHDARTVTACHLLPPGSSPQARLSPGPGPRARRGATRGS